MKAGQGNAAAPLLLESNTVKIFPYFALYPLCFDVTLTTLLQHPNKRNKTCFNVRNKSFIAQPCAIVQIQSCSKL